MVRVDARRCRLVKSIIDGAEKRGLWRQAACAAVAVAGGVPTLLVGSPGMGKSAFARALARMWAIPLEEVDLNTEVPERISGVPYVDTSLGITKLAVSELVSRVMQSATPVIVFLDELASPLFPESRSVWLQLLADLPRHILFIAACNPVDQAENARELSLAMKARFMVIDFEQPVGVYLTGLIDGYNQLVPEVRLVAGTQDHERLSKEWAMILAHFLHKSGTYGQVSDEGVITPRTISLAGRFLASVEMNGLWDSSGIIELGLRGILGPSAAGFREWFNQEVAGEYSDLLDPGLIAGLTESELVALAEGFKGWLSTEGKKLNIPASQIRRAIDAIAERSSAAAVLVAQAIAAVRPDWVASVCLEEGAPAIIRRITDGQK